MAAITKRLLLLRPTFHYLARPCPYTQHNFSSSSDRDDDVPQSEQPQTQSSDSPNLDAVRASLRNRSPPPDRRQPPRSPIASSGGAQRQTPKPTQGGSWDEISSRLAEYRSRAAPPPPSQHSGGGYLSMQELYDKNLNSNADGAGGRRSLDSIRESSSKLQPSGAGNPGRTESLSLSRLTENLRNKADPNANLAGASVNLFSPFSKEKKGRGAVGVGSRTMGFGNTHYHLSLGKKLMKMRPEKRKGKWFSLQELSDRLAKVRAADQEELEKAGFPVGAVSGSFQKIKQQKKDGAKSYKHMSILGSMAAETGPPKDDLVEKYFHPDNMSSAEKMKLELQKVRDEFKMSESDCGSARVQVAQLTTKIKHLSAVLHKKDKHSRKGLHEMVQRRKKLLKYLRRTDWDSYCIVLSKLGLRDNPDIKA